MQQEFSVYDFIDIVLGRPGMFSADLSLRGVSIFIEGAALFDGYQRHSIYGKPNGLATKGAAEWWNWLENRIGTKHYRSYFTEKYNGNDEKALEEFVALYKEFRGTKFLSYKWNPNG